MHFSLLEPLPPALAGALTELRGQLAALNPVVVAYSGGVDSALVAAIALEQCGQEALAITGVSPALAPHLRQEARIQAGWLGIRHREIPTSELADPAYASNPEQRCYACKRELHRLLAPIAAAARGASVVDGVNADDLGMLKGLSNRKTAFAKSATHVQHIVKVSVAFQPLGKTLVGFKTAGIGVYGGSARLVHQAIKVRPDQIARVLMDVDCMVVVRDRHCWVEL